MRLNKELGHRKEVGKRSVKEEDRQERKEENNRDKKVWIGEKKSNRAVAKTNPTIKRDRER